MKALLIGVSSLVVTAAVTPVVIVAARRWGVVDRPGALKPQSVPVPYLGGVAVFAGLVIGAAVGRPLVIVPLAAALGLGVADDRFDLPAQARLLSQLAIGAMVVAICPVHLPGVLAAVTILALVVLVINGVNLIDGLDMLAAGVAAVAGVAFAVILHSPGRQLAVALTGALLGFLLYNRPPARVYLGDGGSYLLGTLLSVLLVETWRPGRSTHLGVAALALVAVPVAEVAFAIVRRARSHRSLVAGDRGHPYDRLVARGWPPTAASLAYIGVEAALAAGVVIAVHQHSLSAAVLIDVAGGACLVVLAAASGALHPDQEAHT